MLSSGAVVGAIAIWLASVAGAAPDALAAEVGKAAEPRSTAAADAKPATTR